MKIILYQLQFWFTQYMFVNNTQVDSSIWGLIFVWLLSGSKSESCVISTLLFLLNHTFIKVQIQPPLVFLQKITSKYIIVIIESLLFSIIIYHSLSKTNKSFTIFKSICDDDTDSIVLAIHQSWYHIGCLPPSAYFHYIVHIQSV